MAVPFPTGGEVNLDPPTLAETRLNAAGMLSATRPATGNTEFQRILIEATVEALTGHAIDTATLPYIDASAAAHNLARRNGAYRTRMVHMMILSALVLQPIPIEVCEQVAAYSRELGIDDGLLQTIEQFATADKALAATDFERNGYTADWSNERAKVLHAHSRLDQGWRAATNDAELAQRWHMLSDLEPGTIGRLVHNFYQARGFAVPGTPGSASPLLAQHDWVHVLAGYGTKVEAELEVFAFIARANDNPRGFSLLAMVVSLFETGYLTAGAGLFEAFPGQLSRDGMADRVGDAMRRGALSHGLDNHPDVDFMQIDWFELANRPLDDVRQLFGIVPKAERALEAGSVTPWELGGISENQLAAGQNMARTNGITYDSHGATP